MQDYELEYLVYDNNKKSENSCPGCTKLTCLVDPWDRISVIYIVFDIYCYWKASRLVEDIHMLFNRFINQLLINYLLAACVYWLKAKEIINVSDNNILFTLLYLYLSNN